MINKQSLGTFGQTEKYNIFQGLCDKKRAKCVHCRKILCRDEDDTKKKENLWCIEIFKKSKMIKRICCDCLVSRYYGNLQPIIAEYEKKYERNHRFYLKEKKC